mmetsp:Transcript_39844/g.81980  ORF Transcript_39844/g.81980 Transcript_39844/m.81980 type:complete len:263 (+) Transcript_39844:2889-3677(+)
MCRNAASTVGDVSNGGADQSIPLGGGADQSRPQLLRRQSPRVTFAVPESTTPALVASPQSSGDESCCHKWDGRRRLSSSSTCSTDEESDEETSLPDLYCCPRGATCVGGLMSSSSNRACSRSYPRKQSRTGRRKLKHGPPSSSSVYGGNEDCGACITIHLPPPGILQSRVNKIASFMLFVYLLCLMRWAVESQKNSLRLAREVRETLQQETRIALEATRTLKELEQEFAIELNLDPDGDEATLTAAAEATTDSANVDHRRLR